MRRLLPALLLLAACASGQPGRPGPTALVPGGPVVVHATEFPQEITGLLSAAEADSCGVCVREKRADAFEIAGVWFAPGHLVDPGGSAGWQLLAGEDQELYFGEPGEATPRLTFRFHTQDDHLVGIASEDFTQPELAARILARPPGEPGAELLEIVRFAYGDGESFHFDEAKNRVQVQCRILEDLPADEETPYGGTLRESRQR